MADTIAESTPQTDTDARVGLWGPYWTSTDIGAFVWVDDSDDIRFSRTTDKGANWTDTLVRTGDAIKVSAWFDQETPGDTGTEIHVAWLDTVDDDAFYRSIDISDGSQGTLRTIDASNTVADSGNSIRIAITKTVSGNLIVAYSTQSEIECYRSTDGFDTSNDAVGDVFETGSEEDWCLLFPANTGADDDACAVFLDRSANEITIKMYDESDSGGTWTEFATAIDSDVVDSTTWIGMDGAVRHSDNHILLGYHSRIDHTTDDLRTADLTVASISTPVITAKTNIFTNQTEAGQVSMFINQQNDHVYLAYIKGNTTWTFSSDIVYHISTDGMGIWGTEQAYSEDTPDDIRLVNAGRTVGDSGGRYQPAFYNDDLFNIFINEVLDIEIAVAGVGVGPIAILTQIPATFQVAPSRDFIIRLFKSLIPKALRSLYA